MKFTKGFKKYFYLISSCVFITGATWMVFEYLIRTKGAFGADRSPFQENVLRIHGAFAYCFMLVIGYLIHSHVRPGLKSRKKRSYKSGWMMIIATGLLIVSSGYDLYGPEGFFHDALVQVHRWLGVSFPLLLVFHLFAKGISDRTARV